MHSGPMDARNLVRLPHGQAIYDDGNIGLPRYVLPRCDVFSFFGLFWDSEFRFLDLDLLLSGFNASVVCMFTKRLLQKDRHLYFYNYLLYVNSEYTTQTFTSIITTMQS
jgi:hypothetical protein